MDCKALGDFDVDRINLERLLFQTNYLTIKQGSLLFVDVFYSALRFNLPYEQKQVYIVEFKMVKGTEGNGSAVA